MRSHQVVEFLEIHLYAQKLLYPNMHIHVYKYSEHMHACLTVYIDHLYHYSHANIQFT